MNAKQKFDEWAYTNQDRYMTVLVIVAVILVGTAAILGTVL